MRTVPAKTGERNNKTAMTHSEGRLMLKMAKRGATITIIVGENTERKTVGRGTETRERKDTNGRRGSSTRQDTEPSGDRHQTRPGSIWIKRKQERSDRTGKEGRRTIKTKRP